MVFVGVVHNIQSRDKRLNAANGLSMQVKRVTVDEVRFIALPCVKPLISKPQTRCL